MRLKPVSENIALGECVYLVETGKRNRTYLITLQPGGTLQTARGPIAHEDAAGLPEGSVVNTMFDHPFLLYRPRVREHMMKVKRKTQIIYPKDAGWLLLSLDIFPGARVVEIGAGSGAFTILLANFVGPQGIVNTFDRRSDFLANALANVNRAGFSPRVEGEILEAGQPFPTPPADAVFLDLPEPWLAVPAAYQVLKPGRPVALIVPTAEQLQEAVGSLRATGFSPPEVTEVLEREILVRKKSGVRPADRMVGFTGYLVSARKLEAHQPGDPDNDDRAGEDPGTPRETNERDEIDGGGSPRPSL